MAVPAVIGGGIWAYRTYKAYRALKALQAAERLRKAAAAAKALEAANAREKECKDCDEDPCKHLRQGDGKGKYRGGAHGNTKGPRNDGLDSHHMPSKDQYKGNIDDLPAIQMEPADHAKTMSNGNKGLKGIEFRRQQRDLINNGKFEEALKREIDDVKRIARESGDPKKYDEAIEEMKKYAECRQKHDKMGKWD
jgi:hypothetical protein